MVGMGGGNLLKGMTVNDYLVLFLDDKRDLAKAIGCTEPYSGNR